MFEMDIALSFNLAFGISVADCDV